MAVKGSIFQNPATSIPKDDAQVTRIDFEQSEMGARRSMTNRAGGKNSNAIVHVKSS